MKKVQIVLDLSFGDAGKGTITDYLTREQNAHTVVRFNGGPQAAHNVVDPEGRHHTFAQFGSGTLAGARTHLSRFMMVNPPALIREGNALVGLGVKDAFSRITVDRDALVISPFQMATNKLREMARGDARHGSCGMGIGETMSDSLTIGSDCLYVRDLHDLAILTEKMSFLREYKYSQVKEFMENVLVTREMEAELEVFTDDDIFDRFVVAYMHFAERVATVSSDYLGEILNQPGTVVFEGSQGVLLDQSYGFHPYTTWSNMTFQNAFTLLKEQSYEDEITRLGVLRAYTSRHGPGPFVTEDPDLSRIAPDVHNLSNSWQRDFRVGYFDAVAARYALDVVGGVDALAVTNVDRIDQFPNWDICQAYKPTSASSEDELLFELSSRGVASAIKVNPDKKDMERQSRLTSRIMDCAPVYYEYSPNRDQSFDETSRHYLSLLEESLEVPVVVASYGPGSLDKRQIAPMNCMKRDSHLLQPV